MLKILFKYFVELTGNPRISRILVRLTTSKWSKNIIPLFIKTYKIDKNEMERDVSEYQTLHDLFTRRLKANARNISLGKDVMISPVDGVIRDFGKIDGNSRFPVKNSEIDLTMMLGDQTKSDKYINGHYIIFYLSPQNYHRIHSPIKGQLLSTWSLGGISYPVNDLGLRYGNRPLSTNFRLISEIKSEHQDVAVVKVGALNVNSIHMTTKESHLKPGDELAYFSFGSTVILLIEDNNFQFSHLVTEGSPIKYGELIGAF